MQTAEAVRLPAPHEIERIVNDIRAKLHARAAGDERAALATRRLAWARGALAVGFTESQLAGDRGLLVDRDVVNANDFEVGLGGEPAVLIGRREGPPRRRPASDWGGSLAWLSPPADASDDLRIGPYAVTRDRAGRVVFERPSRAAQYLVLPDPLDQMIPPPQPQVIEPAKAGERFVIELEMQPSIARALTGPLASAAEGLAIGWRRSLERELARIADQAPHGDTFAEAAMIRLALSHLERHGLAFARFGFDADDLFSRVWTAAGPKGLGLFVIPHRSGSLETVDTSLLYVRPPADDPASRPAPLWASARPRWRQEPSIGPYRLHLRPITGEAILRRNLDALTPEGEPSSELREITVEPADVLRLAELLKPSKT